MSATIRGGNGAGRPGTRQPDKRSRPTVRFEGCSLGRTSTFKRMNVAECDRWPLWLRVIWRGPLPMSITPNLVQPSLQISTTSPLERLHSKQVSRILCSSELPPFDSGIM